MFLVLRPDAATIDRFLDDSRRRPLAYSPVGLATGDAPAGDRDELVVEIGRGIDAFERARDALAAWRHFALDWIEILPAAAPIDVGTTVGVLVRHLGFWS